MSEKLKVGDFVTIKGQEDKRPFTYIVTEEELAGMVLVSTWYRKDLLTKVDSAINETKKKVE
jgi:hypothetical protein